MAIWQISKKTLKRLKVAGFVAATLGLLYLLPGFLLLLPSVQKWAGKELATALSTYLKAPVALERLAADGWSQLRLEEVSIQDSLGRPALSVRTIKAGVSIQELIFEDKIEVNSLRFFDLKLLIDVDSLTGRTNVDHITRAIMGEDDTPSTLTLDLNNVLMRDASVHLMQNAQTTEYIDSLQLKVGLLSIKPDSLVGELEELAFRTQKGFRLSDLRGHLRLRQDSLHLRDIEAYLPGSYLNVPEARLALSAKGLALLDAVQIRGLRLALQDVVPLYQPLASLGADTLRLSASVRHEGDYLSVKQLEGSLSDKLYLQALSRIALDSLGRWSTLEVDVHRLMLDGRRLGALDATDIAATSSLKPVLDYLRPLGAVSFSGRGFVDKHLALKSSGILRSDLGQCSLELSGAMVGGRLSEVRGRFKTNGFDLSPLSGGQLGQVAGEVEADLDFYAQSQYPRGLLGLRLAHLDWEQRRYHDVYLDAKGTDAGQYTLSMGSKVGGFPLSAEGRFRLKGERIEQLRLDLKAKDVPVQHWLKGVDRISIEGEIASSSLDVNNLQATALFPLLRFESEGKSYDLSHISLDTSVVGKERIIRLLSPWLNMRLWGQYQPEHLLGAVASVLGEKLPIAKGLMPKARVIPPTQAELEVELDSLPQPVRDRLNLPLDFARKAELRASIDTRSDKLDFYLSSPEVGIAQHRIKDFVLDLKDKHLEAGGNAYLYGGTQLIGAKLRLQTEGNNLNLSAGLGRDSLGREQGTIAIETQLSTADNRPLSRLQDIQALVRILPSRVRIHTGQWEIAPASVQYRNGALNVSGLSLLTEGRRLFIDGAVGEWAGADALRVQLENINLRYILEAAGVYFDLLDTDLTGLIDAKIVDKHLVATAAVRSPHFYVNKQDVGAIDMALGFSTEDLYIRLKGHVRQTHGGHSAVSGWIKPANGSGIDLHFDARDLDVSFVGSFMDGFLSKLKGYGTGQARLHGLFVEGVTVSGLADIDRGEVGVRALGTEYRFAHRIKLEDERIHLDGVRMYDDEGHSAVLRGSVGHHCFDNFDIQLRAEEMQGIKVLNTNAPKLMPAYGKAYASGTATMQGTDKHLKVSVDLESQSGTEVTLDLNTMTAGKDEGLMRFVRLRPRERSADADSIPEKLLQPSALIDLNLRLNVTPEARLAMRLGEDNNSLLRGRAEGVLQISAPATGNPEVYGTLSVLDGEYLFNLQQLALKRFTLKEGGSVAFRGDAMRATLNNLNAVYTLTANISDLDEAISRLSQRTNIPVHCLLHLSGEAIKPQVRFGLELPGVDAEIERRVRSLLNTEDAVTRQMLYLIALGKFYTSDADTRQTSTTNNWTSVASSAISEQLSSILGGLSETIRLGTSIKTKTTAFEDTDIELNFTSSWLGNRLLINGNLGYHDNPYLNNQYLGEFDFEYKLNRTGSFRLKGYNRYNTMYQYLRQSFLTQGFGVLYRQRFDSLKDLFNRTKKTTRGSVKISLEQSASLE